MARKHKEATIRYLATPAGLVIHLGGEEIRAVNGIMTLTEAEETELHELIIEHGRLDLRIALRKIDTKETEEIVKAHQAVIAKSKRPAAIVGAVTSEPPTVDAETREIDLKEHSEALKPAGAAGEGMSKLRGALAARG